MHVCSVSIRNLRSIANATLELNLPDTSDMLFPNVNVILGDNGAGKSTVLRAIAMAALAPGLADSGYRPDSMVRNLPTSVRGKKRKAAQSNTASARVQLRLHAQDLPQVAVLRPDVQMSLAGEIEKRGDFEVFRWDSDVHGATTAREKTRIKNLNDLAEKTFFSKTGSSFFMVAYGATRRVEASERFDPFAREKSRSPRYARVAGLFEDQITLVPLASWLPEFQTKNKGRYTQIVNLMNALLPKSCRLASLEHGASEKLDYFFEMNGTLVPFGALSDGYKAYIGWIGDMLYHVCMNSPTGKKLIENRGVVLIDEVDLHLHPAWQLSVLPTLSKALPNVQFIVTTHSPLVVGSLEASNLFVLESTDEGTTVSQRPEKVHGANAEQILLSPYFGLDSTRSGDVAAELRQLSDSVSVKNPKAALEYLRLLAKSR